MRGKTIGKYISIIGLAVLSACKPFPYGLDRGWVDGAPPGSKEWREGWKDGCETGMSSYGNDYYKAFYGWKQDPVRAMNDPEYGKGWKAAYTQCRLYAYKWSRVHWDGSVNADGN